MAINPVEKIKDSDLQRLGVVSAPTVLNGTPAENKAIFDRLIVQLVAPTVNAMIENEQAIEDAEAGRTDAEDTRTEAELARAESEQGRVEAEEARVAAEELRQTQEDAREAAELAREQRLSSAATEYEARLDQSEAAHEAELKSAIDTWDQQMEAAEALRDTAEVARATAELSRKSAEQRRDEQMNEILSVTQDTVANAKKVQEAVEKAEGIQAAVGLNRRWRIGPASLINELGPGELLFISDGGDAASEAVTLRTLLDAENVASVANAAALKALNLRKNEEGAYYAQEDLAGFVTSFESLRAQAREGGYVDATGALELTWGQVQYWLLHGTLVPPLAAEAAPIQWSAYRANSVAHLEERINALEAMMGDVADAITDEVEGANGP